MKQIMFLFLVFFYPDIMNRICQNIANPDRLPPPPVFDCLPSMSLKYEYTRHKTLINTLISLQLLWCVTTTMLLGLVWCWMYSEPKTPAQQTVSVLWPVTHPLSLTFLIITTTVRGEMVVVIHLCFRQMLNLLQYNVTWTICSYLLLIIRIPQ